MADDLFLNISSYNPQKEISIQDVLKTLSDSYLEMVAFAGAILFLYVIYNNFFAVKRTINVKGHEIDIDELAILPASILLVISLYYYSGA